MTEKRKIDKVLITGIGGAAGSYLADYIAEHHPTTKVYGIVRRRSASSAANLASVQDRVHLYDCDLTDFSAVLRTLDEVRPDAIFHLASYADVKDSFMNPLAVLDNNIGGTANLLEAARVLKLNAIIQICSSSEVYGQVAPENVPIKEDCPMRPVNPYAVSKATQDLLGFMYWRAYGMRIFRTRAFAYLNPRREDIFATAFAKQVAKIEFGLAKELVHGNLESVRTLIDVRDVAEAYWVAAEKCRYGEAYNIGGTTPIKVGEFLELLKTMARCPIKTRLDPSLLRPADVTLQIPDITKFSAETGWKPKYTLEESTKFLLDYWRERIKREYATAH